MYLFQTNPQLLAFMHTAYTLCICNTIDVATRENKKKNSSLTKTSKVIYRSQLDDDRRLFCLFSNDHDHDCDCATHPRVADQPNNTHHHHPQSTFRSTIVSFVCAQIFMYRVLVRLLAISRVFGEGRWWRL